VDGSAVVRRTDGGAFVFASVPAGRFQLTVDAPGGAAARLVQEFVLKKVTSRGPAK
jgi:hypothetical protein